MKKTIKFDGIEPVKELIGVELPFPLFFGEKEKHLCNMYYYRFNHNFGVEIILVEGYHKGFLRHLIYKDNENVVIKQSQPGWTSTVLMKKIMKTYMTEDARHNEHILRWKRHIEEDEEARKTNEDLTNGRIQVHHEV